MAVLVVLSKQGIEANSNRYFFNILGDPSVLGLAADIKSIAMQDDSNPKGQLWEKLTTSDTGWSLIVTSQSAGASSSTGSWRASAFSVAVDGSTDATAALNTLTGTTMPQTGGPFALIVGPGESVKTASDVTIPATVQLQSTGGVFKPASAKKLTLLAEPTGAGQIFDLSLGGSVVASRPMTMRPEWFGADKTGATNASPAVSAALQALTGVTDTSGTGIGGGVVRVKAGTYKMSDFGQQFGDGFSYVSLIGDGPSTLFKNGTARTGATDFRGIFSFYGSGAFTLKQLRFEDFRLSGVDANDTTRLMVIDEAENVRCTGLYLENNAVEGIVSVIGENMLRRVSFTDCHAFNTGMATGLAAINLNAQVVTMTGCTFDTCGNGFENEGHWSQITNCTFQNMGFYGVMLQSTWSGYLDSTNSYAQVNTFGGLISNCQFSNYNGRGVNLPDFSGHTNTDVVHTSPAHLDGGLGQILIQNCTFERLATAIWGGADKLGSVECANNLFMGQYDSGTGPQVYAIAAEGGTWNIHHNTFGLGKGIQWVNIMGLSEFQTSKPDRLYVSDNLLINYCWSQIAFNVWQDTTITRTRFLDLDGTIAGSTTDTGHPMYRWSDLTNSAVHTIAQLCVNEWAWWDPDHQISMHAEPTKLPVLGDALPAFFAFKPGDTLVNRGTTAKWNSKKCITGGSLNPTPLAITGAATSGTKTLTVSASTGLMQYGWITVPAVPAIANKQIMSISGTTVTVDSNFEATVTAGTSLSWATPVFTTDRDISTLSIASQATGDIMYASNATTWARLGKGADGTYLGFSSGLPAAIDSIARFDAGNTSTGLKIIRTPARQEQKFTLTAATPDMEIDDTAIPSGGYLVTDAFQDGTGSRVPTWRLTSTGTINWVGGSAPTLTTTAGKADKIVWHNEGSRITAALTWQNF